MYKRIFKESKKFKINSEKDLRNLQKKYDDDVIFTVIESEEEITLPDLLYAYDGQKITLEV